MIAHTHIDYNFTYIDLKDCLDVLINIFRKRKNYLSKYFRDLPAIVFYALIGNDVCTEKPDPEM